MFFDKESNPFITSDWYDKSDIRKMPVDTPRGTVMKKYYDGGNKAFIFEAFFEKGLHLSLSNSAIRVLLSIIELVIKEKQDLIYITYPRTSGKSSFYAGLKELIDNQLLAKSTSRYRYWVNPFYFNHHNPINDINKYQEKS